MGVSYCGQSPCGEIYQSPCGEFGLGNSGLAGELQGVGTLSGSLKTLQLGGYNYSIVRRDRPWGVTYSGPVFSAWSEHCGVIGVLPTTQDRYRVFAYTSVPAGQNLTGAVANLNLQLDHRAFGGNPYGGLLDVYVNPSCSRPPVVGDWASGWSGTPLISSITMPNNLDVYNYVIPVPINFFTAGASTYFSFVVQQDVNSVSSPLTLYYDTIAVDVGVGVTLAW